MPYLTPTQARLRDDIRGLVKGDISCDEVTLQLYATDAGVLQVRPQGVVWPRNIDDVVACVRYASEKKIPIHVRGFGTGTAGESLGWGIILDFTRYMRRILSLEHESVLVQPGITRHRLNDTLKKTVSRRFGPVSGFSAVTTIGSLLARNGAGANWLRYGFPSDHLLELKVVLADGGILELDRRSLPQALETEPGEKNRGSLPEREMQVAKGIALARGIVLGKEHAVADDVYRVLAGSTVPVNDANRPPEVDRTGYRSRDILKGPDGCHVDLARLICGSEGTLGLIVEARLATVPLPHRGAAAVLFFNSFEKASRAVTAVSPFRPVLCEWIDRRRLSMVRDWIPAFQHILPVEAEAVLLLELDSGSADSPLDPIDVRDRLSHLIDTVWKKEELCFNSIRIETPEKFLLFDEFLHYSELVLFRMQREFQPLPLFDDPAVPLTSLCDFIPELQTLLKKHGITASISGHVGQGHFRIHPIVDLSGSDLAPTLRRLVEDVYALVLDYRGTVSSEGGTGLLKSQYIPLQYPRLMPVFRNIKEVFDPHDLLNPGKVVPDSTPWTKRLRGSLSLRGTDHLSTNADLRVAPDDAFSLSGIAAPDRSGNEASREQPKENADREFSSQLELQLKWEPQRFFESTYQCNGCGDCLQSDRSRRMCPLFRKHREEQASPRAKANLLRGVLDGELELETLTRDKAKEVADLCLHCQMCSFECPAEVDASQLAFRCKSAYAGAHGLPLEDLFYSRLDVILQWLAMISCPVNWSIRNPWTRWILEKVLQIPQGRKLPKLAKVTYLSRTQWASRRSRPRTTSKTKVALFVDTFANHFDTKLADLAVRVLEHNEIDVHIPSRQKSSGLTAFSVGGLDRAERLARHNTLVLADMIRQGYHVVTLEPASSSCITRDYRYLVDDIDTALVTSNVVDFCDFLRERHRQGKFRTDFQPIRRTIGYHAPCRSISGTTQYVDVPTPAEQLLRLIPELDVRRIEEGCCGLAGTYGLKRKNLHRSLQIGLPLFRRLRSDEIDFGATDCNSCRMQMEHGVRKTTYHPIRLLAAAYGLAPDIMQELETPSS